MKKSGEIKVLLVEDRIDDAELLVAEMRRRGLAVVSLRVESEPAYTHALRHFAPQLILSDYTLPDFDGPLALRIATGRRRLCAQGQSGAAGAGDRTGAQRGG
jgi:CheY-like chemotaxis protein